LLLNEVVLEAMMKFSKFAKQALAVAFAGLVAVPAVSHAALINSLLTPGVVNEIQDTDAERIVDAQGNVVTSGNFQVGYQIQSILRFDTANSETIADTLPSPYKLTSYSELLIAGITGVQTISGVDVPTNAACTAADAKCALVMAPTGNLGLGVMANLYEGPTFSQSVAPATGIAGVQGNTLITQVGIAKSTDFWFAIVSNARSRVTRSAHRERWCDRRPSRAVHLRSQRHLEPGWPVVRTPANDGYVRQPARRDR
jgi:hypothetical protein